MGAGNVKARTEPTPLRLPDAASPGRPVRGSSSRLEDHISPPPPLSLSAGGSKRRWDVVCDVHRSLICRFCGGKTCKHEDYRTQRVRDGDPPPPLHGLHSTLVTPVLLAMQRPSTRLLRDFNLVQQMRLLGVGAVLNLQLAGEHPHCGDGIHAEGFSYRAEELTNGGVYSYNTGWVDMATPSLERMVEIVQIIAFHAVERGEKVAVHCHAGYGRTGIVIACYMLYEQTGLSAAEAIRLVRAARPGCVQTARQQRFVGEFAAYIDYLRRVYPQPSVSAFGREYVLRPHVAQAMGSKGGAKESGGDSRGSGDGGAEDDLTGPSASTLVPYPLPSSAPPAPLHAGSDFPPMLLPRRQAQLLSLLISERESLWSARYGLHDCLSRQRAILHGVERNALKFVPKVLHVLSERLGDLAAHHPRLMAHAVLHGFGAGAGVGAEAETVSRQLEEAQAGEKARREARLKEQGPASRRGSAIAVEPATSLGSDSGTLSTLSSPDFWAQLPADFWGSTDSAAPPSPAPAPAPAPTSALASPPSPSSLGGSWSPAHDAAYSSLKSAANNGSWAALEGADVRHCALMLLEWMEGTREPMLPLLVRGGPMEAAGTTDGGAAAAGPEQVAGSVAPPSVASSPTAAPSSFVSSPPSLPAATPASARAFLSSLPLWTLASLAPVMRMLAAASSQLDIPTAARLLLRFGYAMAHPPALPPRYIVPAGSGGVGYRSYAHRTAEALGERVAQVGLTVGGLQQAAQSYALERQQREEAELSARRSGATAAAAAAASGGDEGSSVCFTPIDAGASTGPATPRFNFDALHSVLPPSPALLASLGQWMARLLAEWPQWHGEVVQQERLRAKARRVGVRKSAGHVQPPQQDPPAPVPAAVSAVAVDEEQPSPDSPQDASGGADPACLAVHPSPSPLPLAASVADEQAARLEGFIAQQKAAGVDVEAEAAANAKDAQAEEGDPDEPVADAAALSPTATSSASHSASGGSSPAPVLSPALLSVSSRNPAVHLAPLSAAPTPHT